MWKRGVFAWEYKGPGKDLQAAYYRLKKYGDPLGNPPLLITCDLKRIEIDTNFTNTVKLVHVIELKDFADPAKRHHFGQYTLLSHLRGAPSLLGDRASGARADVSLGGVAEDSPYGV